MENQIITQEGYDKIKKEIEYLSKVKRKEIADRIEKAKELGDLSENAEYSEAKDAQALNEGRIIELNNILKNVDIIEPDKKESGQAGIGSIVKVLVNGKKKEYTIVNFNESDPLSGKISNESPLGMAFLGKKKGEKVSVKTPKGMVDYKIIDIN
jgi:transcription elongation factor GreA